jgi:hypothetical protein
LKQVVKLSGRQFRFLLKSLKVGQLAVAAREREDQQIVEI